MVYLSPSQVNRITAVAAALARVAPMPLEKWLDGLRVETDPERELRSWERRAEDFRRHAAASDPSVRQHEVLGPLNSEESHHGFAPW